VTQRATNSPQTVWREPAIVWFLLIAISGLLVYLFYEGLSSTIQAWNKEEYSHGYMIPLVVAFLIWQQKDQLERIRFDDSWTGVLIVLIGLALYFLGELSTLYIIIQYAFLVTLFGVAFCIVGWKGIRKIGIPLLFLGFMIPLPSFLFNNLSSALQLISSELGVAVIRLFGISVYLEGNVIDLGNYQLQVVEACSGLRYLFPLMSLAFLCAYFFKGAFWKRAVIFLSSIPITVLMNSVRIGITGVLVDYKGIAMAEGFLHDFEGWFIFMSCLGILLAEMWVLSKIGRDGKRPLREVFGLDFPEPTPKGATVRYREVPKPLMASLVLVVVAALSSTMLEKRTEIVPQRADFSTFPLKIGQWQGVGEPMEQIYIDALKFDDYIMANYRDPKGGQVNFYVAYYGSQRKGQSAHSPRSCLPGDGWRMVGLTEKEVPNVFVGGSPLRVNRVEIRKGDYRQLVYYWFQQRGRVITNEYLVKWFLFWDALTKNRTDGALVRLITFVAPHEDIETAEDRLSRFAADVAGVLEDYIPGDQATERLTTALAP